MGNTLKNMQAEFSLVYLVLSVGRLPQREKKKEGAKENLYFIYYLNKQFYAYSILYSVL